MSRQLGDSRIFARNVTLAMHRVNYKLEQLDGSGVKPFKFDIAERRVSEIRMTVKARFLLMSTIIVGGRLEQDNACHVDAPKRECINVMRSFLASRVSRIHTCVYDTYNMYIFIYTYTHIYIDRVEFTNTIGSYGSIEWIRAERR